MVKKKKPGVDLALLQARATEQFRDLDPKDPSLWPLFPRVLLCVGIAVFVVVLLWFLYLSSFEEELQAARAQEQTLRTSYQTKLAKAVSLDALKKQREQVQQYVLQLEKQLPSKAEMAALLSDINQAGLGRSLQFELFRPGQVVVNDYYAELPITLRVSGSYHDMGSFASDIAHLSRIVTLNNLSISPGKDGALMLDTTARTFRYLDAEEIAQQRGAKGQKK